MKKFNKIAIINKINLTEDAKEKIQSYSNAVVIYPKNDPDSSHEIIKRIGDADAILGNFNSVINASILKKASNLKYIGICGTNIKEIDLNEAKRRKIVVKNVTDYGDEATAEYIFTQILNLIRGLYINKNIGRVSELNSKKLGIVGLGAVGKQVARIALGLNMDVSYYSKSRNIKWESMGLKYQSFNNLLKNCDILSINVPKDTKIIGEGEIKKIGNGKIIIDTCLGNIYKDTKVVKLWLKNRGNFLVRDHNLEIKRKFGNSEGFIYTENVVAGATEESKEKLSAKVLDNIKNFMRHKNSDL